MTKVQSQQFQENRVWSWWFMLICLSLVLLVTLVLIPIGLEMRKSSSHRQDKKGVSCHSVKLSTETVQMLQKLEKVPRSVSALKFNTKDSVLRDAVHALLDNTHDHIGLSVVTQNIQIIQSPVHKIISPLRTIMIVVPLHAQDHINGNYTAQVFAGRSWKPYEVDIDIQGCVLIVELGRILL